MKTTNSKSRIFTQAKQAFEASNLRAIHRNGLYIVYSYKWYPIFVCDMQSGEWFENHERYSVSTSRQKSQSHPNVDTWLRSTEELNEIIRKANSNQEKVA